MKKETNSHSILQNISRLLLFLGILFILYSGWHIYNWWVDSRQTKNMIAEINQAVSPSSHTEDPAEPGIDFSALKAINSDTVGWLEVASTEVHYPFTQTSNNDFYLTHSFDKSVNSAGWIFLDARNHPDFQDQNTILYAHGRLDNTMFGSLKNLLQEKWYDQNPSPVITITTEERTTTWAIFSVYHIPATDDYLQIYFAQQNDFMQFIQLLQNRSFYHFQQDVTSLDKILTLSTCYQNNSQERLVIHAKLLP